MSLQLQPGLALVGDRWPLEDGCPFPFGSPLPFGLTGKDLIVEDGSVALGVRPSIFRELMGLLLLDLALLNSALGSSSSSSMPSSIKTCEVPFFFADRVIGPKYPSCGASCFSDGVGEGEITLGVAGTGFEDDRAIVKGGSEGIKMAPVTARPKSATRTSQEVE